MKADYAGKKALVCGAARSGIAAARLLQRHGALVTVYDVRENDKTADALARAGIDAAFGANPSDFAGVDLLVLSPGIPANLPFVAAAARAGVRVVGEIELAYGFCENPIVAITGTNGKTTTTALVGAILQAHRPGTVIAGNIGAPFADAADGMARDAFAVLEISSFQMETADAFHPRVCAVLNVTPDHLNRHGDMATYAAMKARVFARQNENDATILNADDEAVKAMANQTSGRVYWFSRCGEVERGAFAKDGVLYFRDGGAAEAVLPIGRLQLVGAHNVENALAAVAVCAAAGAPIETIREGLARFQGAPHRIEYVARNGGVLYYNDSKATNPDSAVKALEAMERPVLLIAGGRDKDADYAAWAALFPGKLKLLVLIGEAAPTIERAARAHGFTSIERAASMRGAVALCAAKAAAGDAVLLSPACASFDMFDDYEQRGDVFRKCVSEL